MAEVDAARGQHHLGHRVDPARRRAVRADVVDDRLQCVGVVLVVVRDDVVRRLNRGGREVAGGIAAVIGRRRERSTTTEAGLAPVVDTGDRRTAIVRGRPDAEVMECSARNPPGATATTVSRSTRSRPDRGLSAELARRRFQHVQADLLPAHQLPSLPVRPGQDRHLSPSLAKATIAPRVVMMSASSAGAPPGSATPAGVGIRRQPVRGRGMGYCCQA